MDEQIHIWVNGTVVMEITGSVEWSNGLCITSIEVNGTNLRGIWLRRLGYFPARIIETVCDNVRI
jgi:hypothetical protein